MFLETVRLLTDRMNDATAGVNAKLAGVPRSGGDAAPSALALIADETRNIHAAIGRLPDKDALYPCLLGSQPEGGNALDPHAMAGANRDGSIDLLWRYALREVDAVKGTRDLHYTMRAVQRVVEEWLQAAESARTLSGIYVMYCQSMRNQPAWMPVGDKVVVGGMLVTFRVRDSASVS